MTGNDTQYWIVVNRNHAGPYTASQLKTMGISPDTYAWHRGLTQWVPASDIPELAAVLWPLEPAESAEETVVEIVEVSPTPPPPPARPVAAQQPTSATGPVASFTVTREEACPPRYFWWSIVVALLFFLPLGVVAVIFSSQVSRQWRDGDLAGARRSSERAYWFSITGFVAGLMLMPFQAMMMLL